MKLNWNFLGWEGSNQETFCGEGMEISRGTNTITTFDSALTVHPACNVTDSTVSAC